MGDYFQIIGVIIELIRELIRRINSAKEPLKRSSKLSIKCINWSSYKSLIHVIIIAMMAEGFEFELGNNCDVLKLQNL